MRILVQRVTSARVSVAEKTVGAIDRGLVLLVGVHAEDEDDAARFCADKCANLRIFPDEQGRMNRSLLETGGAVLAISQFTLYGDCRRGRRPSFVEAARPELAEPLYERFVELLEGFGITVARGVFGAFMKVEIHNDGPVTVIVESP